MSKCGKNIKCKKNISSLPSVNNLYFISNYVIKYVYNYKIHRSDHPFYVTYYIINLVR